MAPLGDRMPLTRCRAPLMLRRRPPLPRMSALALTACGPADSLEDTCRHMRASSADKHDIASAMDPPSISRDLALAPSCACSGSSSAHATQVKVARHLSVQECTEIEFRKPLYCLALPPVYVHKEKE